MITVLTTAQFKIVLFTRDPKHPQRYLYVLQDAATGHWLEQSEAPVNSVAYEGIMAHYTRRSIAAAEAAGFARAVQLLEARKVRAAYEEQPHTVRALSASINVLLRGAA